MCVRGMELKRNSIDGLQFARLPVPEPPPHVDCLGSDLVS